MALVLVGLGVLLGFRLVVPTRLRAEVRATEGSKGLSTKVNGKLGGRCKAGICLIRGGTNSGKNKFHRFSQFDTRGKIKKIEIDPGRQRNLVIGVTSPYGTHLNKMVSLSRKANLFWLSPGGISLTRGASFTNVPRLNLSTARTLRFPGGVFDAITSTPADLSRLQGDPLRGAAGFGDDVSFGSVDSSSLPPGIYLDGINVSIDDELLLDAPGGRVELTDSRLSVSSAKGTAGTLTLMGDAIEVDGTWQTGGGTIQVGGSWQNSDPSVRQATTTRVAAGALIDASARLRGDGERLWFGVMSWLPIPSLMLLAVFLLEEDAVVEMAVGLKHQGRHCRSLRA